MANEGFSLAPLLEKLGQNPAALSMLQNLMTYIPTGGTPSENSPQELPEGEHPRQEEPMDAGTPSEGEEAVPIMAFTTPKPPPGHGHGHGRREVLLSLRPFLSKKRCASVDRVLRALELYEVIESTHH